ncbi:MAG TPA: glyoxalase superfamily protein [Myxococcota bacterium]|nr:glyoxalase superfamily protein [Myxococcota bacterium]
MATIRSAAPQLLVKDLRASLDFYRERLGFGVDFVYEGFYAAVSRGGAVIHLKCAEKLEADRAHRRVHDHLDAFLDVVGVRELFEELKGRGAPLATGLEQRPWNALDFHVVDPYGYILCFSASEP